MLLFAEAELIGVAWAVFGNIDNQEVDNGSADDDLEFNSLHVFNDLQEPPYAWAHDDWVASIKDVDAAPSDK